VLIFSCHGATLEDVTVQRFKLFIKLLSYFREISYWHDSCGKWKIISVKFDLCKQFVKKSPNCDKIRVQSWKIFFSCFIPVTVQRSFNMTLPCTGTTFRNTLGGEFKNSMSTLIMLKTFQCYLLHLRRYWTKCSSRCHGATNENDDILCIRREKIIRWRMIIR